jgi:hypothetical protein
VSDTYNHKLKVIDLSGNSEVSFSVSTWAGQTTTEPTVKDGKPKESQFNEPMGIWAHHPKQSAESCIFVADTSNNCIRQVSMAGEA